MGAFIGDVDNDCLKNTNFKDQCDGEKRFLSVKR
jgi:hypothetical protein